MPSITRKTASGRTRRDAVQAELLDAVERLLEAGESYTSLGVQRICDEAGVARSAFYTNFANKSELLLVLERPEIPLHTNGSERDIRDHVKKQKVSGGTRSETGRQCRDTFSSLKKTCRKLGVSFWDYLIDRIAQTGRIPFLPNTLQIRAASA